MQEQRHHIEAFDEYYAMGEKRSLVSLAGGRKVSAKTTKRWSVEFNWQERISQRDLKNGKKILAKTDRVVVNTKADYRAQIKKELKALPVFRQRYEALISNAKEAIEKKQLEVKTITELRQLSGALKELHSIETDLKKLDLALIGESGEQETVIIDVNLPGDVTIDDV